MKRLITTLAILLILIGLMGVGVQLFLTRGLTSTLNRGLFPAVETLYGVHMSITNASVNILKGTALLDGFSVRNLQGYQEPHLLRFDRCALDIDLMSLIRRDPIVIERAEISGAQLVIERNAERAVNVHQLAQAIQPFQSAPADPTPDPDSTSTPAPDAQPAAAPLPIHIRRSVVDLQVVYADSKRDRGQTLGLQLTASDLFSVPAVGQPQSLVVLRGALTDRNVSFVTDLNAVIDPLVDPAHPSFNASGSILNIDAALLEGLLGKNDMKSGPFSIRPSIRCQQGQLEGSSIQLELRDLEIYQAFIGETNIDLPVNGTLKKPVVDLSGVLRSLLSEQALDIGKTIGIGELKKELGLSPNQTPQQNLMGELTNRVEEIQESPALQKLIEKVIPGEGPDERAQTNQPIQETIGDALIEQLENNVKEIKDNEAIHDLLHGILKR